MNKVLLAVVVVVIGFTTATNAQTPYVAIFFDEDLLQQEQDCPPSPPGTVEQDLYVVAGNFAMWMSGIEYMISYPSSMSFIADTHLPGALWVGSSDTGIGISFPTPLNGWERTVVQTVSVSWMCDACTGSFCDGLIEVLPHPNTGYVRAVRWPDSVIVNGVGLTSVVCARAIPVEQTTWGQVKALYR